MQLSLNASEVATDLWVHDGMVAVRINDNGFKFFVEPLVASTPVKPLNNSPPLNTTYNTQAQDYTKLLAYAFAPKTNETLQELTLFGVYKRFIVKTVFTLDEQTMNMTVNTTEVREF